MLVYHPKSDAAALAGKVYDIRSDGAPVTAALPGHREADLAVIGGGFTGLSAALHAAEAGANVVLLEANEIGWGASGRNFGQVVPYLRHEPAHALRYFGPDFGNRLVAAAASTPDLVFGLIEQYNIACEPRREGLLFAAHSPRALRQLAERKRFWESRGVALSLNDRAGTSALIGGGAYFGSLLDPRGGTINPLGFARGLARAAIAAGAAIHTHSNVTELKKTHDRWLLKTQAGSVRAKSAVIATNAYSDGLWPGLQQSIVPVRIHQLASAPIGENLRGTILPGGHALTDTRRMASGVRLHADGRLHVSADGPRFSRREAADETGASARLLQLFPQLGSITWNYSWSGWVAMTPEEYPRLHQLAPSLFAALDIAAEELALRHCSAGNLRSW